MKKYHKHIYVEELKNGVTIKVEFSGDGAETSIEITRSNFASVEIFHLNKEELDKPATMMSRVVYEC